MEPVGERFILIRHHWEGMVPHPYPFSTLWYQVCNGTGVVERNCRQRGCGSSGVGSHVSSRVSRRQRHLYGSYQFILGRISTREGLDDTLITLMVPINL